MNKQLLLGNNLETLKTLADNSVDSVVTDPPAGISFMGKEWDDDKGGRDHWIKWLSEVMSECNRVLKPGGHAVVWGLPRTSHWTATAVENAGFEIRDVVTHLFGTGFPKSMNIEKAVEKSEQPERSKEFAGLGTALKPASEHWIVARKPLSESTVAKNVLKWGTGGINVDQSRISSKEGDAGGRWPANIILDEEAAAALDEQSGILKNGGGNSKSVKGDGMFMNGSTDKGATKFAGDSGGASRFFYVAKAAKKERGEGNTHPTVKPIKLMEYLVKLVTPEGGTVLDPFMGSGTTGVACSNLGFSFIGCELDPQYFEISSARIAAAAAKGA